MMSKSALQNTAKLHDMDTDYLMKFALRPTIHFLDRSAVIEIKKYLDGKKADPARISRLKTIDKRKNVIFTYLAAIEGNKNIADTQQKESFMLEEAMLTNQFFKKATTDTGQILQEAKKMIELGHEPMFEDCLEFYKRVSSLLCRDIPRKEAPSVHSNILSIADDLNICHSDLIVICSLAKLWGNQNASAVLQFKNVPNDGHTYGAVSDMMYLTRIYRVTQIYTRPQYKYWNNAEPNLVCFDKGLSALSKQIFEKHAPVYKISFKRSLFPNIVDKQWEELIIPLENQKIRFY